MSELQGNKDQPGPMYVLRRRPHPARSYTAHNYFGLHPAHSNFGIDDEVSPSLNRNERGKNVLDGLYSYSSCVLFANIA